MAKHKKSGSSRTSNNSSSRGTHTAEKPAEKPATLKDMLSADVLSKLQAQADALKAEEARKLEEQRQQEEAARKTEQKRLDNDFEHLLKNSKLDWKNYK